MLKKDTCCYAMISLDIAESDSSVLSDDWWPAADILLIFLQLVITLISLLQNDSIQLLLTTSDQQMKTSCKLPQYLKFDFFLNFTIHPQLWKLSPAAANSASWNVVACVVWYCIYMTMTKCLVLSQLFLLNTSERDIIIDLFSTLINISTSNLNIFYIKCLLCRQLPIIYQIIF